jgi:hypothetical protein
MDKVLQGISKIVLGVFTVAIVGLMGWLTFGTLGMIYPDDVIKQVWGLALFSGGTVSWFVIFLYASKGSQRSLAMVMFGLSLIGEVVYSAADLFMGGQTWVAVDPRMGTFVLWTFVGMTFAHGAALYAHFIAEPGRVQTIELEVLADSAEARALELTKEKINSRLHEITDALSAKAVDDVLVRLNLPVTPRSGLVIDSKAEDVPGSADLVKSATVEPAAPISVNGLWPGLRWPVFPIKGADKTPGDASFRDEAKEN